MTITEKAARGLFALCELLVEYIKDNPTGVSGGQLYALLMPLGCTLAQYESVMAGLVGAGKVVKRGEFYYGA